MTEPTASRPWADLNRMEAVERVLVESGRAMSPREMSRDLGAHGRDGDRAPLVSAALNSWPDGTRSTSRPGEDCGARDQPRY